LTDLNEETLELNTSFYTYMKRVYGAEYSLDDGVILTLAGSIKSLIDSEKELDNIRESFLGILERRIKGKKKDSKIQEYERLAAYWSDYTDVNTFVLAMYMVYIKNLTAPFLKKRIEEIKPQGHPLSINYDNVSVTSVYRKRALYMKTYSDICDYLAGKIETIPLAILQIPEHHLKIIKLLAQELSTKGLDIKGMLFIIINESVNQSIVSNAGGGYEDRIHQMLLEIGIDEKDIKRLRHEETGSIEHDFIFTLDRRRYGISAKRTLRERYKQYVNLVDNNEADVLTTITFGTDLTPAKARTIRGFGVYIFISPEIHARDAELRAVDGVFSIESFDKETLRSLK